MKKILFLAVALIMSVGSMWAGFPEEGVNYRLKNFSRNNAWYYWSAVGGTQGSTRPYDAGDDQVWTFEASGDATYPWYIKSVGQNKYMQNINAGGGNVALTTDAASKGKYKVEAKSGEDNVYRFSCGTGLGNYLYADSNNRLDGWSNGSEEYFTVEIVQDVEKVTLTYNYTNGGKVWYSEQKTAGVGEAFPSTMTMPYGVTADKANLSGTVSEGGNVEVPVTYTKGTRGFDFSEDFASAKWHKWYKRSHWNNGVRSQIHYDVAQPTKLPQVNGEENVTDDYLWAAIGNPFSFKIINRAAGDGKYLSNPNATISDSNEPYMQDDNAKTQSYFLHDCTNSGNQWGDYNFRVYSASTPTTLSGNGTLNYWVNNGALGDDGSRMIWEFVDVEQTGVNWNAYENLLTELSSRFGTELGKYSVEGMNEYEVYEELTAFNAAFTAKLEESYDENMEAMQTMKSKLTLNMPKAGTFLRARGVVNTEKYLQNTLTNNGSKYNMATDKDATAIFYYDGEHLLSYTTGRYVGVTGDTWEWTAVGGTGSQVGFTDCSTKGAYFITIPGTNTYTCLYSGVAGAASADRGAMSTKTTDTRYHWFLEEVTELPVTPKAGSKGFATLYAPVKLVVPADETVYTLSSTSKKEGYIDVVAIAEDEILSAETGIILKGTEGTTITLEISTEEATVTEKGELTGTFAAINKVDGSYVFSVVSENPGFYMFEGATLAGFKAYYVPTTTPNVQGFVLNFGGESTTGIISVNENANANVNCFDLAGRRVNANVKGISIVNGKKIVK